ncbi:MAG TPA: hypothetical protein VM686_19990 [Polyangiaceae bacterium]|nr:hypothetical protein [Polyangiaceae bacterium]
MARPLLHTGVSSSSRSCVTWDRAELSEDQLAALEAIELVPLDGRCTSDGFSYEQLTVFDMEGGEVVYRDTGCDYLNVYDAAAMLPRDSFDGSLFPWDMATDCPE